MSDCTKHSILCLSADDAKCFRKINNIEDCERLQSDLNSPYEWSQILKVKFNVPKCKDFHSQEVLLLLYLNSS